MLEESDKIMTGLSFGDSVTVLYQKTSGDMQVLIHVTNGYRSKIREKNLF